MNFKWLVEIWIGQHHFPGNDPLCHVESDVLLWSPIPLLLVGCEGSEGSEDMRSLYPHVSVVIDDPNEAAQLFAVLGSVDGQDGFYLIW
jgi:hypothetical protein